MQTAYETLARTLADERKLRADLAQNLADERANYQDLLGRCSEYQQLSDGAAQRNELMGETVRRLNARVAELEEAHHTRWSTDDQHDDDEEGATSDLFACIDCSSMWLLTKRSNREHVVTLAKPGNEGKCGTCSSTQASNLLSVKECAQQSKEAVYIVRPLEVGSPRTQSETCVKFVANSLSSGPVAATAKVSAEKVVDAVSYVVVGGDTPQERTLLGSTAAVIDKIPTFVAKGFAWLATDLFGLPPFLGEVVGRLCATVVLGPHLHQVAQCLRVADVTLNGDKSGDSLEGLLKDVLAADIKKDLNDPPSVEDGSLSGNVASGLAVDPVLNLDAELPVADLGEIDPPPPRATACDSAAEVPTVWWTNMGDGASPKHEFRGPGHGFSFG
ncbi:hypothetical protein ACIRSS_15775 [Amycolatopsis sp. NPDC101161]|uniref:hypothetical protein n=1 Tax=Amycolatopsis sp. NPDC101161 TaxID=3363940 RepID=UPI003818B112